MQVVVRRVPVMGSLPVRHTMVDEKYPVLFELLEPRLMRSMTSDELTPQMGTVDHESPAMVVDHDVELAGYTTDIFDRLDLDEVESANGVALQADGKVIVFGWVGQRGAEWTGGDRVDRAVLARYSVDGTLDTTFGANGSGYTVLNLHAQDFYRRRYDVAIAPDGRIFVAAGARGILRFAADGTFQTMLPGTDNTAAARSLLIQPDGKIVFSFHQNGWQAVARISPDGMFDSTFGVDGRSLIFGENVPTQVRDLALAEDGSILVTGWQSPLTWVSDAEPRSTGFVAKLTSAGALDRTFASGGIFSLGTAGRRHEQLESLLIGRDGTITAGGELMGWDESGIILVRLNEDGTLDQSFGEGGVRCNTVGEHTGVYDLQWTSNGRVIGTSQHEHGLSLLLFDNNGDYAEFKGADDPWGCAIQLALAPDGSLIAVGLTRYTLLRELDGEPAVDLLVTRFGFPGMPPVKVPEDPTEVPKNPDGSDSPTGSMAGGAGNDVLLGSREDTLFHDLLSSEDDLLDGEQEDDEELLSELV